MSMIFTLLLTVNSMVIATSEDLASSHVSINQSVDYYNIGSELTRLHNCNHNQIPGRQYALMNPGVHPNGYYIRSYSIHRQ